MPPAPLAVAGLTGVATIAGLLVLALDPDPFSSGSAALLAIGLGVLSIVTITGTLLARGRWTKPMSVGLGLGWFGVALTRSLDPSSVTLGVLGIMGASAAAGPWLDRWTRRLPAADGPPPAALAMLLILIGTPIAAALVDPSADPTGMLWVVAVWSLMVSVLLARAVTVGLWAARILHLPLVVVTVALTPAFGASLLIGAGLTVTILAWRRDVGLAVRPLVPPDPVPIPPELVDPTIMRAAGLDDRGTPLP